MNDVSVDPRRRLRELREAMQFHERQIERLSTERAIAEPLRASVIDGELRGLRALVESTREVLVVAESNATAAQDAQDARLKVAIKEAPGALSRIEAAASKFDAKARELAGLLKQIESDLVALEPLTSTGMARSVFSRSAVGYALAQSGLASWLPMLPAHGADRANLSALVTTCVRPTIQSEIGRLKAKGGTG